MGVAQEHAVLEPGVVRVVVGADPHERKLRLRRPVAVGVQR